jgi:ubiquinone/menaquinone biosynthesis C-methylase UbiE
MPDQRKDYFDYHAPAWDTLAVPEKQERLLRIFNEFIPAITAPILDLGCGTGVLIPILANILPDHSKIIELDIACRMLQQARDKNKNNKMINYINGDVHFLPFTDQSFPTAICFESLPHFRDLTSALQELHRVLQPGGKLIILHLMGCDKLNKYHDQVGGVIRRDYLPTVDELARHLARLRFELIQVAERDDLYLTTALKRQAIHDPP